MENWLSKRKNVSNYNKNRLCRLILTKNYPQVDLFQLFPRTDGNFPIRSNNSKKNREEKNLVSNFLFLGKLF